MSIGVDLLTTVENDFTLFRMLKKFKRIETENRATFYLFSILAQSLQTFA